MQPFLLVKNTDLIFDMQNDCIIPTNLLGCATSRKNEPVFAGVPIFANDNAPYAGKVRSSPIGRSRENTLSFIRCQSQNRHVLQP